MQESQKSSSQFFTTKEGGIFAIQVFGKDETGQLALISYRNEHGEHALQIANRDQLRDRHWLEVTTPDSPSPHPRDRRTEIMLAGLILGKTWEEILAQLHKEGHEA